MRRRNERGRDGKRMGRRAQGNGRELEEKEAYITMWTEELEGKMLQGVRGRWRGGRGENGRGWLLRRWEEIREEGGRGRKKPYLV